MEDFLAELEKDEYREVRWVVEEVLSIVNGFDLAAIHEDLSFRQRRAISPQIRAADEEEYRLFERDPFIYFYGDYLKAYDPAMRKGRGVYYTPPPVVNFIVRAIDDILKDSFGIRDGLADHRRVTVLDFACGTGTFLLEVCQRIFENIGGADSARADLIVRDHILQNLFGFEYLIAPYTIAHLKLSQRVPAYICAGRARVQGNAWHRAGKPGFLVGTNSRTSSAIRARRHTGRTPTRCARVSTRFLPKRARRNAPRGSRRACRCTGRFSRR